MGVSCLELSDLGASHLYDFKQLSPADFEDLTRDLLQRQWDIRLEAFKTGRDQGIDLRCSTNNDRSIIVQCKHFAGSTIAKLIRELRVKEVPKVKHLAPQRYVLVTSLPLSPNDKTKVQKTLHPYVRTPGDIFGAEDLNNLLAIHSDVETQHFKLWLSSTAVLQRVLHNAEQVQTDFDVDRVRREIPLYVQTSNYTRAMRILGEHRVVIISGVPGIGKTMLADMLLFAHMESSYQPHVIKSEIVEGRRQFRSELRQIFYFDDFLGETFLGNRFDFLGKKEDSAILDFIEIIARSKHGRLILTAREHILSHAFQISEHFRRREVSLASQKCILTLSDYSLLDRGRILYNHIYFSDLPVAYKLQLLKDAFYMQILKHRNFNPRLVEWLARFTNVRAFPPKGYQEEVRRVLDNPEQLWRVAFEQQISDASRSVLLALYSLGGNARLQRLEEVWKVLHRHRAKKYNWRMAAEDWRQALRDLEGGFLTFDRGEAWFVNPSVRDFLDTTLSSDTEHLDDLLSTASMFDQIVCVWSLARSPKGVQLQGRFNRCPDQLVRAISQNLRNPFEEELDLGGGAHGTRELDARPEVRLQTLISIADTTRSGEVLRATTDYSLWLVPFWSQQSPDFRAGVAILRALDRAVWPSLGKVPREQIKRALLSKLSEDGGSGDIVAVVDYARDEKSAWSEADEQMLVKAFKRYLEDDFYYELRGCRDQDDYESLSESLDEIATWCGVDVTSYEGEIRERIDELSRPEDEEDRSLRNWGSSRQPMSEYEQEFEVKRIFDGLQ
jgi:hypothetical protein